MNIRRMIASLSFILVTFLLVESKISKDETFILNSKYKFRSSNVKNFIEKNDKKDDYIVILDKKCSHSEVHSVIETLGNPQTFVAHEYHSIFHGVAIRGMKEVQMSTLTTKLSSNCVKRIVKDSIKSVIATSSSPPWGLDRIDQRNLPLNEKFQTNYTGAGVDVYVVDTGLDTNHIEFATGPIVREVKNIFDASVRRKTSPGTDTDGHGHGTHVAGTIGGKTVGIAPGANIYGLKVLSDSGEGSTSDILSALEYVQTKVRASGRPSVVSMSLGGPCDTDDCSRDMLVQAAETLVADGIVVSVASGNSGCNACYGSPNAAPNAINVGATSIEDKVTFFSNFGQCIDIFAPGYNVKSAAAKRVSGDETSYWLLSGTSMACPHVSGVVALMLEKMPDASPLEIVHGLECNAQRDILHVHPLDTISRNLLLQVPDFNQETCSLGSGCDAECSNAGVCLHQRTWENAIMSNSSCYCDSRKYGPSCTKTRPAKCSAMNAFENKVIMKDTYGDGWSFARYGISSLNDNNGQNPSHSIVSGALDSLCDGDYDERAYCLPTGDYQFQVDMGGYPAEVAWNFCNNVGGAPFIGDFTIDQTGKCTFQCPHGKELSMTLGDTYGDGWNGGYFGIFEKSSGNQLFGGTMFDGGSEIQNVCLPSSNVYMALLPFRGSNLDEIKFSVCDHVADANDIVELTISSDNQCVAKSLTESSFTCPSSQMNVVVSSIQFNMKPTSSANQSQVKLHIFNQNHTIDTSTIFNGDEFVTINQLCLPTDCYHYKVTTGSENEPATPPEGFMWGMCGARGTVPASGKMCIDATYGLCYGLSGCPLFISHEHYSNFVYFVIYSVSYDPFQNKKVPTIEMLENIHSVHEICFPEDREYLIAIGAGRKYTSSEMEICGTTINVPSMAKISASANGTSCEITATTSLTCPPSQVNTDIMKIDLFGDGWGTRSKYIILDLSTNRMVHEGTLSSGQIEYEHLCLSLGVCYSIHLEAHSFVSEILWIMCGYVGNYTESSLTFCVHEDGCAFVNVASGEYKYVDDDDFPSSSTTELYPTLEPTQVVTSLPTFPSTAVPTFSPSSFSSAIPTLRPTSITSRPTRVEVVTASPSLVSTVNTDDGQFIVPNVSSTLILYDQVNVSMKLQVDNKALLTSVIHGGIGFASLRLTILKFLNPLVDESSYLLWEISDMKTSLHLSTKSDNDASVVTFEALLGIQVLGFCFGWCHEIKSEMDSVLYQVFKTGAFQAHFDKELARQLKIAGFGKDGASLEVLIFEMKFAETYQLKEVSSSEKSPASSYGTPYGSDDSSKNSNSQTIVSDIPTVVLVTVTFLLCCTFLMTIYGVHLCFKYYLVDSSSGDSEYSQVLDASSHGFDEESDHPQASKGNWMKKMKKSFARGKTRAGAYSELEVVDMEESTSALNSLHQQDEEEH